MDLSGGLRFLIAVDKMVRIATSSRRSGSCASEEPPHPALLHPPQDLHNGQPSACALSISSHTSPRTFDDPFGPRFASAKALRPPACTARCDRATVFS